MHVFMQRYGVCKAHRSIQTCIKLPTWIKDTCTTATQGLPGIGVLRLLRVFKMIRLFKQFKSLKVYLHLPYTLSSSSPLRYTCASLFVRKHLDGRLA